jgi:hypothetical protein
LAKDARQRELAIHNKDILQFQEGFEDQKRNKKSFATGTQVLVFVPWVPAKLNQGLADRWHGPFIVMQATGDSYFLQSTRTNHARNQWIKVSRSRVRKLIHLNEPLNIKSSLSDDKYVEPDLRPWTAIIEGPGDLSGGELEVTVAPTAVTSVLFDLEASQDDEGDTHGMNHWTQQCSSLLDRYRVHDEQEHPNSSRNYVTGDYITFLGRVRDNPTEAARLRETLSSSQVASIRETPRMERTDRKPDELRRARRTDRESDETLRVERSDRDPEVRRPDELTDEDIMNHYVLLPHQGQLKGRTLADVEGESVRFRTIVYCTAAGESLNHLRNWTSLNYASCKRATSNMDPEEVVRVEFINKSKKFTQNTWIEMDTSTIPHSYKLLGSWHRYDKVS